MVALAFVDGAFDQVLEQLDGGAADPAQGHGVTEQRHVVVARQVEMTHPHPAIGEHEQFGDGGAAVVRDTQIDAAEQLQHAVVMVPGKMQPVVAPAAGDPGDQFGVPGSVERPVLC